MRCDEAREAVLGGEALATPSLKEHLEACTECSGLAVELARSPGAEAELDSLRHRVEGALQGERGLVAGLRSLPTRWRMLMAASAAATMALALAMLSPRVDFAVYPLGRMMASAAMCTVLLVAIIAQNLRPLQAPDRSRRALWLASVAIIAPFSIALLPEAKLAHPVAFHDAHDCLLLGTLGGAALMTLLGVLDRRESAHRSLLVPAAAGGMLANLALLFHCPVTSPLHLVVIHAPIGIVLFGGHKGFRAARMRIARARAA